MRPGFLQWGRDVLTMSMNFDKIAILNVNAFDICCVISRISKSEAINLLQNVDLTEKSRKFKT